MMQVRSLASLNGLRIQYCGKLQCRVQKRLGSRVAVAVAKASAAALIRILAQEPPHATGMAVKRKKNFF